ncbi:3-phosphoshikimate 1-carboxyvinyltransferase [Thermosynechococcus sp. QKsg1]|uniref:3-phosphoshikimate 1-carboxyvinyltransferase n=1 Tax=unclassified Thermosynechococcus TaxID=2622553 RepID=UPI00122E611B|nr:MULTISPECIES: 3-phosphoshikimate 1-carboxyvinyltransferase [unclassified Thermosynechococcus]QEP99976.1 3-phosphoshikimate 1-carboxyvinyltransferase [Thermosynechococcus sp. CL-1]WJI26680.1 3-phosphoshikimate 1-carboxyvinyltransferase [Thermosynechococcus sp. B1]WKT83801.1 3-phosphoshikimate 1-carboxyvinyltransferase [Thermosynechococcus sp. HY596]WNC62932.1 3-phosphoshikimate 1-carboxyvinyltransferase [Thermosynechococcus sp. HY591]WNC65490.1 3-phosphoshikimate 1-carboxyvinyltransferase [T
MAVIQITSDDTWQIQADGHPLQGTLQVPGDKSISHRALMLGAMAEGTTHIEGLLVGEDTCSTAACFRALGAEISDLNATAVTVQGLGIGHLQEPVDVLNAGNSGTTMRLLLGVLAAQTGRFFTMTGDASLRSRPMARVVTPLMQMGAQIWGRQHHSRAPLAVLGQPLEPITYSSPIASAQVKSALLLAALHTEGTTIIREPHRSRDHSERMLQAFGACLSVDEATCTVSLEGPAVLKGQKVIVPGDISSAAFWLVAASITPDSELVLTNVGVNPTRTGILDVLWAMGAEITLENERLVTGEPVADLRVRSARLQGTRIGGELIPRLIDEIPILAVAAAFAEGITEIRDAAELRVKESDRLKAVATELQKMGAKVTELSDGLDIQGGVPLQGTHVETYGDHRMAMSLAIAALNATGTSHIHNASAAAVSYPEFVTILQQIA